MNEEEEGRIEGEEEEEGGREGGREEGRKRKVETAVGGKKSDSTEYCVTKDS